MWNNIIAEAAGAYLTIIVPIIVIIIDAIKKRGHTRGPVGFDLLNRRYVDSTKLCIISSERTLPEVADMDEAVAGRIYERAHTGGYIDLTGRPNWRFGNGNG